MYAIIKQKTKGCERILVAGDAHYWPGKASTAHRALLRLAQKFPPEIVVLNGDMFDGDGISTHAPKGWFEKPSLKAQLKTTKDRLASIVAHTENATHIYLKGNHEMRFDKKLATHVGAYKGIAGMSLADHFPDWITGERLDIEGKEPIIIKHELSGGSNPLKSNLQKAGTHIVTGHLHNQNVLAFSDFSGTRYAVDHGCIAVTTGPQFSYGESDPVNWRSGFVVLQLQAGRLLPPQLCTVLDEKKGEVWYNGYTYKV